MQTTYYLLTYFLQSSVRFPFFVLLSHELVRNVFTVNALYKLFFIKDRNAEISEKSSPHSMQYSFPVSHFSIFYFDPVIIFVLKTGSMSQCSLFVSHRRPIVSQSWH